MNVMFIKKYFVILELLNMEYLLTSKKYQLVSMRVDFYD